MVIAQLFGITVLCFIANRNQYLCVYTQQTEYSMKTRKVTQRNITTEFCGEYNNIYILIFNIISIE